MKKITSIIAFLFAVHVATAAWIVKSETYNGNARDYKVYLPSSLQNDAKVVVLLHGLGGTMNDFDMTSWSAMADTANIILISPQGLPFSSPAGTIAGCFNSGMVAHAPFLGAIPINGSVDDVGFISHLIDEVKTNHSIDITRVYVTGFSNGGFMTQRLACELSGRLAAIASVSGTRSVALNSCVMGTQLPVAHFHGTADTTVYWNGYVSSGAIGEQLGISVDSLLNWWKASNQTSVVPDYEDTIGLYTNPIYIEHSSYLNTNGESVVELFKIINGTHNYWYNIPTNGFDISIETWKFFNHFTNETASIMENDDVAFLFYPNPASSIVNIKGNKAKIKEITLLNYLGQIVLKQDGSVDKLDVSTLQKGLYMMQIETKNGSMKIARLLKQ